MVLNDYYGGFLFVLAFSLVGAETTVSPPPNCCPHNTHLDHIARQCTGGEQPVFDCGGHTKFLIDPADEGQPFLIGEDGSLHSQSIDVPAGQFCLVKLASSKHELGKTAEGHEVALACHIADSQALQTVHTREIILVFFYFVSLSSLILVLIAHVALSSLRDLQGRCHMATVFGLFMGFTSLLIARTLTSDVSEFMCQLLAFSVYYWMLSAFFWLNVTAFNIWRSVLLFHVRFDETRLFIGYSLYAWGVPLSLLILTAAMHFLPEGYAVLKPHFGLNTCWFHDLTTQWSYFYGPVAILLILNLIFFVWTTICLWSDYTTTCLPMKRRLKKRCLLSVKMFLVMGIGWIFELISSLDDGDSLLWFLMDLFNVLQGLVILMVLIVLRRRFWQAIHSRRPCGLDAPQWAIKRFLADDSSCVGKNMEELKHLQSTETA